MHSALQALVHFLGEISMNAIAQAFAKVFSSGGNNTTEADTWQRSYKKRERVSCETLYDGGARVIELKTGSAVWNDEHEVVSVGRFVRVDGVHEFVNFTIPGMAESEIGQNVVGFFTIDKLIFNTGEIFYEIVVAEVGVRAEGEHDHQSRTEAVLGRRYPPLVRWLHRHPRQVANGLVRCTWPRNRKVLGLFICNKIISLLYSTQSPGGRIFIEMGYWFVGVCICISLKTNN